MMMGVWGTWEELVLAGAVIRHGTAAWDAVAAELRARTPFPSLFTPQECEAKYEDLQERFSGCDGWFEELRKRRVAELKRELERSEDSIGSLQSRLESLNAERGSVCNSEYDTSRTESPSPSGNIDGVDSSIRAISKDRSSAGSFAVETDRGWSSGCQLLPQPSATAREHDLKMEMPKDFEKEKAWLGLLGSVQGCFKKKRGKRKRKVYNVVEEGSVGDNDACSSAIHIDREEPSEGCNLMTRQSSEESHGHVQSKNMNVDLKEIMDSIMEHVDASIFQSLLQGQKKTRYKKKICWDVDLQSISSRVINGSISSAKDLCRNLLLLSNNALVFYPKNSLEYKSALTLRDLVAKTLGQSSQHSTEGSGDDSGAHSRHVDKPNNPVAMHACNQNISDRKGDKTHTVKSKKAGCADVPTVSSDRKRGIGWAVKGGRKSGRRQQESPKKGRKKARKS